MNAKRWSKMLTLGMVLSAAGWADAADVRGRCGVRDPTLAEALALESVFSGATATGPVGPASIPVHVHVITTATDGGDVSGLVPAQLDVLNGAFASSGFSFELASLEVVANDAWFFSNLGDPDEIAMKAALRRGGPESLNLYTTNGGDYLGWATFPIYYPRGPSYDGVVVYWATLPGTGFSFPYDPALEPDGEITYDQGDTGTHEVGHWLGLYHTFQGGCSNPADFAKDTPAEAAPNFFCAAVDSCTGKKWPGADPVHNFMDYTDDVCLTAFSADQAHRMQKQWKAFRD